VERGRVVEFPSVEGTNYAVTLADLERGGRLDTPAGRNALTLASRLDSASGDTGSSIAALSKQHLAALAEALKDAPRADDGVDELAAFRTKRRASGG